MQGKSSRALLSDLLFLEFYINFLFQILKVQTRLIRLIQHVCKILKYVGKYCKR